MFLKKTYSKNHTYLSLTETFREDGKVKHRTIAQLGRLDELLANSQLKRLVASFERLLDIEKKVRLGDLEETDRLNWGAEKIYRKIWDEFDLSNALKDIFSDKRITYDAAETVFLEVISRLIKPSSKLKLHEEQQKFYGINNVNLHNLYRILDLLSDKKELIEDALFFKNKNLFNLSVDVVFYDVTTIYFESVTQDDIKNFGYSKDCKFGEVQIVMGLLVDIEGRPIGFDIYPGNTFEAKTLEKIICKLKNRFSLREVIIVADRGINTKINLKTIKDMGLDYIVGSRLKSLDKSMKNKVLDHTKYNNLFNNDVDVIDYLIIDYENQIKDGKKVVDTLKEKLYCTWSSRRSRKDQHDRNRLVEKAKERIKTGATDNKRGIKKYIKSNSGKLCVLDEEKIELDKQWDGYYGMQCSRDDLSIDKILESYNRLWKIEESFRVLKSNLEVRPVFHWTPKRINGHMVVCFISFLLQRTLELKLLENNLSYSTEKIRKSIEELELSVIKINEEKYFLRSKINHVANDILKTLKIGTPKHLAALNQF